MGPSIGGELLVDVVVDADLLHPRDLARRWAEAQAVQDMQGLGLDAGWADAGPAIADEMAAMRRAARTVRHAFIACRFVPGRFLPGPVRSLADLPADLVLLLVQRLLLGLGDVAAVLRRHGALFLADLVVFAVQLGGLGLAHLALGDFGVDALVLVRQPGVDFGAAGMVLAPGGGAGRAARCGGGLREAGHGERREQAGEDQVEV